MKQKRDTQQCQDMRCYLPHDVPCADARLWAAAPLMLETLRVVRDRLKTLSYNKTLNALLIELCDKAIRKAEEGKK